MYMYLLLKLFWLSAVGSGTTQCSVQCQIDFVYSCPGCVHSHVWSVQGLKPSTYIVHCTYLHVQWPAHVYIHVYTYMYLYTWRVREVLVPCITYGLDSAYMYTHVYTYAYISVYTCTCIYTECVHIFTMWFYKTNVAFMFPCSIWRNRVTHHWASYVRGSQDLFTCRRSCTRVCNGNTSQVTSTDRRNWEWGVWERVPWSMEDRGQGRVTHCSQNSQGVPPLVLFLLCFHI